MAPPRPPESAREARGRRGRRTPVEARGSRGRRTPVWSRGSRGRRTPVWSRGRLGRLSGGLLDYLRTAWWGLFAPRLREEVGLEVSHAVILTDSPHPQVLLSIRSDLFGWELPGGTLEQGESPRDALRREVREETGLEIEVEQHVGDWIREGFRPHVAHVYRCRVSGGELAPSHETPRVAWFDPARPPEGLFPWYRVPLAHALTGGPAVEQREWQGVGAILLAMRIDLGMRWRGLPPPAQTLTAGAADPGAEGAGPDEA